jgi:hypothetical protein
VVFIQHDTTDLGGLGVAHGAFIPTDSRGKKFLKYRPRTSIEFRPFAFFDYKLEVLKKELGPEWTEHTFKKTGQRYWHSKQLGSTWLHPHPETHPGANLFGHRDLHRDFHPPSGPPADFA